MFRSAHRACPVRRALPGLTLACVLGVSVVACSDSVMVNRSEIAGGFTGFFYVQTSAQNGTNAVVVRNSPVPDAAVVDALRARYQSGQYRFASGPVADWNGYTLVLGFGGAPIGNQNLCQNPNLPLVASGPDATTLLGEYCYGDILVTEAQGRTAAITGPDDPKLNKLVGDVVAELFFDRRRYGGHGKGSTPP